MVAKEINSLQHPIIKKMVKLREDRHARSESGQLLIVGQKLVAEIAAQKPLAALFLPSGVSPPEGWRVDTLYWLAEPLFKKLTGLVHPELIAAVVALPKEACLKGKKWILALDGVSDPGNLGTLLRTALALGWEGVFLVSGSADPFNEKAVRAAKGACLYLPLCSGTREALLALAESEKWPCWIADLEGEAIDTVGKNSAALLILGNEAHGVSSLFKSHFSKVTIPLMAQMESLNVATAGAILMYQLKKRASDHG